MSKLHLKIKIKKSEIEILSSEQNISNISQEITDIFYLFIFNWNGKSSLGKK